MNSVAWKSIPRLPSEIPTTVSFGIILADYYPTFQRYPGILVSWKIGKKDFSSSGRASCTGNGAHERAADALTGNQDNVRGHTGVS